MDTEALLEILTKVNFDDKEFLHNAEEAESYYKGDNDIKDVNKTPKLHLKTEETEKGVRRKNPIRKADNRIACNFYAYLVDQKASYLVGKPPQFDVGNDQTNQEIDAILGSHFDKTCKRICVDASNCTVGWIHSWIDADGFFHYSAVDPKQIHPLWGSTLNHKLLGVMRTYTERDDEDLKNYEYLDFFDDTKLYRFRKPKDSDDSYYKPVLDFTKYDLNTDTYTETNEYEHGFSKVPFSAFFCNGFGVNELSKIKGYIDAYDMAFSCFIDDLEDSSQVIFLLYNAASTDMMGLLQTLRTEGGVKLIQNEYVKEDLKTLAIEIPIEARKTVLDLCRKNIFEQGQGVDPSPENYGGETSGVALKYMYANLELKATATKDEFKIGFEHFIELICEYLGFEPAQIEQIWTPTKIENTTEIVDQLSKSQNMLSKETIIRHHPFVDSYEEEVKRLKEDEQEQKQAFGGYPQTFIRQQENEDDEV